MNIDRSYEAIIIGGGPAGSSAATALSQHCRRVAVLEKDRFPRYHVGESLVPYCYFPLERIGIIDKMKKSRFTKKLSVQFASSSGRVSEPFYFFKHMDHAAANTWQVVRSEFDQLMIDHAADNGADVFQGMKVKQAIYDGERVAGVIAVDDDGQEHRFLAPVTIDASGRNSFFMTKNGWREPDRFLEKVSIWTYYKGAKRDEGIDEGATTVAYLPQKGWFWYIPLPNDMVSVGVVADKEYLYVQTRDPETIFNREVENNQWIKEHLAVGERVKPFMVTGDYSYRSRYSAADGLVLTGDAFAFLDPVFSTGMLLALTSGVMAADAVHEALKANDVSAGRFAEYSAKHRAGLESMRRLVYVFYDEEFNFRKLFEKYPEMVEDVTDCLIGDLDKDYSAMFDAISEFAKVPEPLAHGGVLHSDKGKPVSAENR